MEEPCNICAVFVVGPFLLLMGALFFGVLSAVVVSLVKSAWKELMR